jgi:hypothetical protein
MSDGNETMSVDQSVTPTAGPRVTPVPELVIQGQPGDKIVPVLTFHEKIQAKIRDYLVGKDQSKISWLHAYNDLYPEQVHMGQFEQCWQTVMNPRAAE